MGQILRYCCIICIPHRKQPTAVAGSNLLHCPIVRPGLSFAHDSKHRYRTKAKKQSFIHTSKAISYGRVLKTKKITRNCVFIYNTWYVLLRILEPESDQIRLTLVRILTVFWGEVSRPVFRSPGVSFEIFTILLVSDKKIRKAFSDIYRRFNRKNRLFFRGNWSVSTIFSSCYPEETVNGVAYLSQNG